MKSEARDGESPGREVCGVVGPEAGLDAVVELMQPSVTAAYDIPGAARGASTPYGCVMSEKNTSRGWVLGRIKGIPVVLAPSWFIIAALVTYLFAPNVRSIAPLQSDVTVYLIAFGFAVLLCLSVFLHEVAHGLVGLKYKVQVREFAINLWGGHTQFDSEIKTPGASAVISIVGPLANAVIGGAAWAAISVFNMADSPGVAYLLVYSLAWSNLLVAVFNIVPGLPLDGGRVLEALVWKVSGSRVTGTVAAGWCGRVVAVGVVLWFGVLPYINGGAGLNSIMFGVLIGLYLWSGASASINSGKLRGRISGISARGLAQSAVIVAADSSVAQAEAALVASGARWVVVVAADGRPAAYIDPVAAGNVPMEARPTTPISAVAVPLPYGVVVDAELEGQALIAQYSERGGSGMVLPVVESLGGGQFSLVGLLWSKDLIAALRA